MSKHQPTIFEIGQAELDGLRTRIPALEQELATAQERITHLKKDVDTLHSALIQSRDEWAAAERENKELREALANAYERAAQVAETYESKHTLSTEMLRFDRNPTTLVDGIAKEIRALAAK